MLINRIVQSLICVLVMAISMAHPLCAQQLNRAKLDSIARHHTLRWEKAKSAQARKAADAGTHILVMPPNGHLPMAYEQTNLDAAIAVGNQQIWRGGLAGFSLTGNGQTIGYWDADKPRLTHQEFTSNRVSFDDTVSTSSINNHATQMVGTMVAEGVDAEAKGMAFEAEVNAYNWNNDTGEMANAALNDLKLSEHPYANTAGWKFDYRNDGKWTWYSDTSANETKAYQFGYYDSQAKNWDEIVYNAPDYLIVKAAGNARGIGPSSQPVEHWIPKVTEAGLEWQLSNDQRPANGGSNGYETLTSAAVAKNVLVVGGVKSSSEDFSDKSSIQPLENSSFGPTDDGRIKPDLVAPGDNLFTTGSANDSDYSTSGGTSASSSVVAGSAALLQQHYSGITSETISAATLKSLLIHTADDLGPTGPDYKFGWGLLNTERAARFLSAWDGGTGNVLLSEVTINDGGYEQLSYQATGDEPVVVTIGWTDPKGTVPTELDDPSNKLLVNDIDLRVTDPNTTEFTPWILDRSNPGNDANKGDNDVDNIEQIVIENPVAGTYDIDISHKGSLQGGSQIVSVLAGPAEPKVLFNTISDGDWSQSSSWEGGQAPVTSFHRAVINHEINLDQDAVTGGITFSGSGAKLNLESQQLTIYGSVENGSGGIGFGGTDQSELLVKKNPASSDPLIFISGENHLSKLSLDLPLTDSVNLGTGIQIHSLLQLANGTLYTVNHPPTLVSDSENAAVLDVGDGTINGPVNYARLYHYGASGWRLLSVPFEDINFSSLGNSFHTQGGEWAEDVIPEPEVPEDPASNLWLFDEESQSYNGYYGSDSTFAPANGYLFYMYEDESDGTPILPESWTISGNESGNTSVSLYYDNSESDSYNLVGNPFSGVLDWHEVVNASTNLGTSYAVWDPAATTGGGSSGFKYYNKTDGVGAAGRYIAPLQGFFVTATGANADLSFNKDQKVTGKDPEIFGKQSVSEISSHIRLQLLDQNNNLLDSEIYLVFNDQASAGRDASDVPRLHSLSGESATLSFLGPDRVSLAFEGRSLKTDQEIFELKPEISTSGDYIIKWPVWHDIPENWQVILRDGQTGAEINMRIQKRYRFEMKDQDKKKNQAQSESVLPKKLLADHEQTARFRIEIKRKSKGQHSSIPTDFAIKQNYPNPFNPTTSIPYEIPEQAKVSIKLYNVLGQEVLTLVNEEKPAGFYELNFDASNLASGLYFYRIKAGEFTETKSMTLIK